MVHCMVMIGKCVCFTEVLLVWLSVCDWAFSSLTSTERPWRQSRRRAAWKHTFPLVGTSTSNTSYLTRVPIAAALLLLLLLLRKKGGNSPQPGIAAPNAAAAHLFPLNFDAVQLYCCEYTTLHREFSHFYLQVINSLLAGNGASLFKAATGCTTTRTTGIVALFSYSMLCLSMKIKFCHGKKYSGLGHENLETVSTEQLSQCCLVQIKMLCFFQQVFIQQFH